MSSMKNRTVSSFRNSRGSILRKPSSRPASITQASPSTPQVLKKRILDLASMSDRGLTSSKEQVAQIRDLVSLLCEVSTEQQQKVITNTPAALSATWRLLWTTEKETLWILKNAGIFGTYAGEVRWARHLSTRKSHEGSHEGCPYTCSLGLVHACILPSSLHCFLQK
jgi:hypothetical protein